MASFKSFIVGITVVFMALFTQLQADSITVTVRCSNGAFIPRLPVQAYDSAGTEVEGLTTTDSRGQFIIQNSETYSAPFWMSFTAKNGSTCGMYFININSSQPDVGVVSLNYYPTNVPCSCAHL